MKRIATFLALFMPLILGAQEIDADQLEGLSDCDYFKYTQCTGSNLTIGACVKKKYDGFIKACGKVHADNFMYSREKFKPPKKKGKKSCDSAMSKLCEQNGLSLSECASKHKDELKKSCGEDFAKKAAAAKDMDVCFQARQKACGNEVTPACDAKFQASAPAKCKNAPTIDAKPAKGGGASEKTMLTDCSKTIDTSCQLNSEAIMKGGEAAAQEMRKYKICISRTLKKADGKCGKHFPGGSEEDIKKAVQKANP